MDHSEAVEQMAAEKYLLGELPPDLRDAFEEHMFDCPECAFDIRAAASFVSEAKVQLPGIAAAEGASFPETTKTENRPEIKRRDWMGWLRPLFASPLIAGPVFAALLIVVGYQNLITYPALKLAASEPRLLPSAALHAGTRGGPTVVEADRKQGVLLQVELPEQAAFATYVVDLYDPEGKLAWTHNLSAPPSGGAMDGQTLPLMIPGAGLRQGSYALAISGVTSAGQHTEIDRHIFDIHFTN
jgi:hypothetical protein